MAKLRFKLNVLSWGYRIDGKKDGTGFLVVDNDNSVTVKTLFKTEFLFDFSEVTSAKVSKKEMSIKLKGGRLIEIRSDTEHLESLQQLIEASSRSKSAA